MNKLDKARDSECGFPESSVDAQFLVPSVGDFLIDMAFGGEGMPCWVTGALGDEVTAISEEGNTIGVWLSGTGDGLHRSCNGADRDGWSLEIVCKLPCDVTVWRLSFGVDDG